MPLYEPMRNGVCTALSSIGTVVRMRALVVRRTLACALGFGAVACAPAVRSTKAEPPRTVVTIRSSSTRDAASARGQPPSKYDDASGPAVLAALPPDAAIYVAVHLDLVDRLPRDAWHSLLGLDKPVFDDLIRSVRVDPRRAVVGAISPPEPDARAVLDAVVDRGTSGKALDRLLENYADRALAFRVVVPILPDGDPSAAARRLAEALAGGAALSACSDPKACADFRERPLGVAVNDSRALAVYAASDRIRVDLVESVFGTAAGSALVAALGRFGGTAGGPGSARCSAFDGSAAASSCVDVDRAALLGAGVGYGKVVRALRSDGVRPDLMRRIAEEGRNEADQCRVLAAPARRLLDDGTLVVRSDERRLEVLASWSLTAASRTALESAFSSDAGEACARDRAAVDELLTRVLDSFGDPGPDFHDGEGTLHAVQEAGWGAWAVLFGRTWPNALASARDRFAELGPDLAFHGEACARTSAGRLEIRSTSELPAAR